MLYFIHKGQTHLFIKIIWIKHLAVHFVAIEEMTFAISVL